MTRASTVQRLPSWFRTSLRTGRSFFRVQNSIAAGGLHTVCQSAACPNRNECWNRGTATFLILGDRCTRNCRFCAVPKGQPAAIDREEPQRVADAVAALGLRHAVVTSVTRDDLPDGGAGVFAETIGAIRRTVPRCRVEVLIPDLQGSEDALAIVLKAFPDILNHNVETVPSLYPSVRPEADFKRSVRLLHRAKELGMVTKSGLMLGLGEGIDEVRATLRTLRRAGCDIITVGQYLRPRQEHLPVKKYYSPQEFSLIADEAAAMGFRHVAAGPLVRSSYHAERHCQSPITERS